VNNEEEIDVLDDKEDMRMVTTTLVAGIELARLDRIESVS
jgi:hypothetical protein